MARGSAYGWLLWGFVFVLLNFYIQGINLFPDSIGYALIAIGAHGLRQVGPRLQRVYYLSFPLIILSLPNVHQTPSHVAGNMVIHTGSPLKIGTGFLAWCLSFFLVFNLCKATEEIAARAGEISLAEQSMVRWKMYVWLQVASVMVVLLTWMHAWVLLAVLGTGLLIYAVIVLIAFITWLSRCRRVLQ